MRSNTLQRISINSNDIEGITQYAIWYIEYHLVKRSLNISYMI